MERIFITGLGVFACDSPDLKGFWETLRSARGRAERVSAFDPSPYPTQIACQISGYDASVFFTPKQSRRSARYTQFACIAAHQALADANISSEILGNGSLAVYEGSSLGPAAWFLDQHEIFLEKGYKRANPLTLVIGFPGAASAALTSSLGIRGISAASTGGSVASIMSLSCAYNALRLGEAQLALVVGAEAPIHPAILASFCTVNIMSRRNSTPATAVRPFDRERDGFVLGEGAGALLIETESSAWKRNVFPYAEIKSIGISSDDYHVTSPEPTGEHISRAMQIALSRGDCEPESIDYINAHGTATIHNDEVEARAIRTTFGPRASALPVTSIKGTIGHLLGACGVVELIASTLAIKHQEIPPTAGFSLLGDGFGIRVVSGSALPSRIVNVLNNNYSFGGKNTSVLLSAVKQGNG